MSRWKLYLWRRASLIIQGVLLLLAVLAAWQLAASLDKRLGLFSLNEKSVELADALSLAFLSAWIFNLLVVVIPATVRRARVRNWLADRYQILKDRLNRHYHALIGLTYEEVTIERLRSGEFWSEYFSEKYSSDQNRWHAVHNALYKWGLREIESYCEQFESDCEIATVLAGELSYNASRVLGRVRAISHQTNIATPEYDQIKSLLWALSQLHCHFRVLDGEIDYDPLAGDLQKF